MIATSVALLIDQHLFVGRAEYIVFHWIILAACSGDNPVGGADGLSTVRGIDPAMLVPGESADIMFLVTCEFIVRMAEVAHNGTFLADVSAIPTEWVRLTLTHSIIRVVSVLEPLMCFYNTWSLFYEHISSLPSSHHEPPPESELESNDPPPPSKSDPVSGSLV